MDAADEASLKELSVANGRVNSAGLVQLFARSDEFTKYFIEAGFRDDASSSPYEPAGSKQMTNAKGPKEGTPQDSVDK
jgi:hypothetical protein